MRDGDEQQIVAAKVAFLQAIAGKTFPTEMIPELIDYLKAQGFDVGEPGARGPV